MDFLADMTARRQVHQVSSPELSEALKHPGMTAYIGFDPTAASLHVGSLLPIIALRRFADAGHRPLVVIGGGTGLIGDPSGKASERAMLTRERLDENLAGLRAQIGKFIDFNDHPAGPKMVDNADWLCSLNLVEFLRDVGKHFSVNAMMARDSVRTRLTEREQGISYTEFTYMLLQAYDFLALHDRYGCVLQMGGSDQWGNILSGTDLIRRVRGRDTYGLTFPLLTRADGKKFGKSEEGNVWLDPALTSPYEFFQFWLNTSDSDVESYLLALTLLPLEAIAQAMIDHAAAPQNRTPQKLLATTLTAFVHSPEALASAQRTTDALFGKLDWSSLSPDELRDGFRAVKSTVISRSQLGTPEASLIALLEASELFSSKGQAKTGVQQGGVSVNNAKTVDPQRVLGAADLLPGGLIVLRKGKKDYHVVRVTS